jgi:maltose alpha-D-glucosyltransferase/alpha-amylase
MTQASDISDPLPEVAGIGELLNGAGARILEQRLVTYLPRQRWFGAKSRTIKGLEIADAAELAGLNAALVFLQLTYEDDSNGVYQLPLAISAGEDGERVRASSPAGIVAEVAAASGSAILHDAVGREDVRQAILNLIATNGELRSHRGVLRGRRSSAFDSVHGENELPARTGSAEQSNTSILYGSKLIMKLFRRLQPGENPDTEIGRFLTETAHFPRIAPFLGDITLEPGSGDATTLAMLQGLVANDGDGWEWTLGELSRAYERSATLALPDSFGGSASFAGDAEISDEARAFVGSYLDAAALLGQRTAEMHLALATPTENPAFRAEAFTGDDLIADAARIETQLSLSLAALERGMSHLDEGAAVDAAVVLSRQEVLFARARALASVSAKNFGQRIRIHGDYHLGQVLRSRGDYVILDFEGEPARTLAARRAKQSPLKDVAGMLRSYSYAAYAGLNAFAARQPEGAKDFEIWAGLWQNAVSVEFLRAYRRSIGAANSRILAQAAQAQLLLDAYLLEKALYELLYELDNRPAWVRTPLSGILTLLG